MDFVNSDWYCIQIPLIMYAAPVQEQTGHNNEIHNFKKTSGASFLDAPL